MFWLVIINFLFFLKSYFMPEMIAAIRRGDLDEVLRLIDEMMDGEINTPREINLLGSRTYLEVACIYGHSIPIITALIERGALFTQEANVRILHQIYNQYDGNNGQITGMQIIAIMLENEVDIRFFEEIFNITVEHDQGDFFFQIINQLRVLPRFDIFPDLSTRDFINQLSIEAIEEYQNDIQMSNTHDSFVGLSISNSLPNMYFLFGNEGS